MKIAKAVPADSIDWLALRGALWPNSGEQVHRDDIARLLADDAGAASFIARNDAGLAIGFAEAALRRDYVNGTKTSPVAFLEGIFVLPTERGLGVARALVAAVENWARAKGCSEFASDALLDNVGSHAMHKALGFAETQRVVFFKKRLTE